MGSSRNLACLESRQVVAICSALMVPRLGVASPASKLPIELVRALSHMLGGREAIVLGNEDYRWIFNDDGGSDLEIEIDAPDDDDDDDDDDEDSEDDSEEEEEEEEGE